MNGTGGSGQEGPRAEAARRGMRKRNAFALAVCCDRLVQTTKVYERRSISVFQCKISVKRPGLLCFSGIGVSGEAGCCVLSQVTVRRGSRHVRIRGYRHGQVILLRHTAVWHGCRASALVDLATSREKRYRLLRRARVCARSPPTSPPVHVLCERKPPPCNVSCAISRTRLTEKRPPLSRIPT